MLSIVQESHCIPAQDTVLPGGTLSAGKSYIFIHYILSDVPFMNLQILIASMLNFDGFNVNLADLSLSTTDLRFCTA